MKKIYLILGLALLLVAVGLIYRQVNRVNEPGVWDNFARCLAEKDAVMYGAEWCGHCQAQKKEFGSSFRLVPYVECPQDPQKCLAAGITGYPTWILADNKRLEGKIELETLAQASGCALK